MRLPGSKTSALRSAATSVNETIAVALILSANYEINWHITESGGNTFAANIALRWNEAGPTGLSALIASGLVPGTYQVTAELQGFKKFDRQGLRLEVGKTATIDVTLEVGGLEETGARLCGPGEGALLVAEQLALQQICRDGAAVHRDERMVPARARAVDRARNELLSCPRFPGYQD